MRNRTIKQLPGTDIVEVRYAGAISYAYRIDTLDEIARVLQGTRVHQLLINYTSAWPSADVENEARAAFGERLGRLEFAGGARIALVNAPGEVNAQTIAEVSPAGPVIRQFHDRSQAIEWLAGARPDSD